MALALLAALSLAAQPDASPPQPPAPSAAKVGTTWPALGVTPGGRWVCDPEHERERQADLALARADLPKGLKGAAPDLPQLEAALAHAPTEPVGGTVVCDGRTFAFNSVAALAALLGSAAHAKATGAAPVTPFTVDPRPLPYADLALLVGSLRNAQERFDLALPALDRGLAAEPENPKLTAEKAYALNRIGRSGEAADISARCIAATGGAPKQDVARLHRSRGYALGELGRFDDAIAEYRTSQALDPPETSAAREIAYLEGRKAGRPPLAMAGFTSDQGRKPPG